MAQYNIRKTDSESGMTNNQFVDYREVIVPKSGGTFNGAITAPSFSGDGSNLTNLPSTSFSGYGNTIIVALTGGDYTSVKDGLDAAESIATSGNPIEVDVMAGVYNESPMSVGSYVTLSLNSSVIIYANDDTNPLLTMDGDSTLNGGSLFGPTASTTVLTTSSSTTSFVQNTRIYSGLNAFKSKNSSNMLIEESKVYPDVNNALVSEFGGDIKAANILSYANTSHFYASSGTILIQNCGALGGVNGLYATNGGQIESKVINISGATYAVRTGVGVNEIKCNLMNSKKNGIDIYQESGGSKIGLYGVEIDESKFDVDNWADVRIDFTDGKVGDKGLYIFGELHVGYPEKGSKSSFGEGNSISEGELIYLSDGLGAFTSVTEEAISSFGSTFSFSGNSADNAIYVSSDYFKIGTNFQFGGLNIIIDSATDIGLGEIVWEFWNGTAWAPLNTSFIGGNSPYVQTRENDFTDLSIGKNIQVRFNDRIYNDWEVNDPISSGTNRYWVRIRIDSTITTSPVFQKIRLHTNSTLINDDGWVEYFGKARPIGTLPWNSSGLIAANNSPADQDIYISDTLGVGRVENNFIDGKTDRTGFVSVLPQDLDTSSVVEFDWVWYSEGSSGGDVRWVVRWGYTNVGDNVYGTTAAAPTTGPNQQEIVLLDSAPLSPNVIKTSSVKLDISDMVSRVIDGFGDLIWCTLERTGGNAADTHTDDVVLVEILPFYTKWCNGGRKINTRFIELFSEDFEGASLSAFTLANDSTNVWEVGTATSASGSYSAYISADGGTNDSYNITTTNISHMYVDVAIPSSVTTANLTFAWQCQAEDGPGSFDYDFGKVYMAPTSETPVAGSQPNVIYQVGQDKYVNQTGFVNETIQIPPTYIGSTVRIIFTWDNDSSIGAAPPFCIDNVVVKYL
jgi:hypothetical protein